MPTVGSQFSPSTIISTGGRINDIPMIHRGEGGREGGGGERESIQQEEGKSEEEGRFSVPRGCLQHCMQMKKAGRQ